jgi:hypothetical protein
MARQDRNKATWPDRTGTKRKESGTVSGQTIILTPRPFGKQVTLAHRDLLASR